MDKNNTALIKQNKFRKIFTQNTVTMLLVIFAYVAIYFYTSGGYAGRQFTNMITSVSCYVALAVSLNLVVGMLGELSLGHAGFMSVGLFSGCLVSIATTESLPLYLRLPISMVVGGLFAAVAGLVVGLPALRLKGDYLAIVTLGCGEIIKNVITNLELTGGALGLNTISIYKKADVLLPYSALLVILTVLVVMNIKNSRQGRAIMAIRDNRIAAEATGINATYYKLIVFIIAAFFAGMAGVLYGHSLANIKANTFDYNMSIEILVIVVLGGMGSIRGSIIAAIILRALPEMLRELSDYRMLAYSVVLILLMLFNESPMFAGVKSKLSIKNLIAGLKEKNKVKNVQDKIKEGE